MTAESSTATDPAGAARIPALPPLPDRLVVGLDGSAFGGRALPVARDLAVTIGAELTLLSIVEYAYDFEERAGYLAELHREYEGHLALLFEDDARQALARRQPGELLCLATRGRSEAMRSLVGSVAFAEVAMGRPSLLVGYSCSAWRPGGPVVVPIESHVAFDESIGRAAAWAAGLDTAVTVVTVTPGGPSRRDRSVDRAVAALEDLGAKATATVLDVDQDPIVTLTRWSKRERASLVVAPSTIESGQPGALLRSHVADLVSRVRAPVLVVPSHTT